MDLHELMSSLQQTSDLELLRLRTAIDHLLQHPARIVAIRQRLHIGQEVDYLNLRENRMRRGRIIEFKPDQVLIHAEDLSKYWWVPYASIQIDSVPMPPAETATRPTRHDFAVGDTVSFEGRDLIQRFGTIVRVNQKTATLSSDGQEWRVSFALLRHVIDL
jgi:ribosome maturation factor RimP